MDVGQEVELLACNGNHSDHDAAVQELVDNGIQRYCLLNGLLPDASTVWFYFFSLVLGVLNHVLIWMHNYV
jgi:hypothetical protein